MKRLGCLLLMFCLAHTLTAEDRYVIGIHGLLSRSCDMRCICTSFTHAGLDVYLWEYPSTEGTICEHAQNLVQFLQYIAQCRPEQPIDFVTHSVGALILRQALNVADCPEEAKTGRAVLLAPTNQGSRLARESKGVLPIHIGLGSKLGYELMTYDPCTIQSIGPFPESLDILVIAGCRGNNLLFNEPNDGFLAVSETALETPYSFESFKLKHGDLLVDPCVLQTAYTFILNGSGSKNPDQGQQEDAPDQASEPTEEKTTVS
ncbi:MAG: hypothetical protein JSS62_02450 [Verrucomicrobia bacterium]|nr:hypothetical protein [Verrucomicrobiota bacterium]MBS0646910.1 hypothetical protein [Verrucomicrobiota bacterium]